MNDTRNEELEPGYNFTKLSVIMGKRLFNTVSLLKKEGKPGDTYHVRVPKLSSNQVFIPDTMNVSFNFLNGNTKSRFKTTLVEYCVKASLYELVARSYTTTIWKECLRRIKICGKATLSEKEC